MPVACGEPAARRCLCALSQTSRMWGVMFLCLRTVSLCRVLPVSTIVGVQGTLLYMCSAVPVLLYVPLAGLLPADGILSWL